VLFSAEDRALNKNLHQFEEYGLHKIPTESLEKN